MIVRGVSVLLALCLGFARDCERCERITRLCLGFARDCERCERITRLVFRFCT